MPTANNSFGRNSGSRGRKPAGGKKPFRSGNASERPDKPQKPGGYKKSTRPFSDKGPRPFGDKPSRPSREKSDKPFSDKPSRPYAGKSARPYGDKPSRPYGDKAGRSDNPRSFSDKPARPYGDKPGRMDKSSRPFSDKPTRSYGDKSGRSDNPRSFSDKPTRPYGDKPGRIDKSSRPFSDKPTRSYGDKPGRPTRSGRSFSDTPPPSDRNDAYPKRTRRYEDSGKPAGFSGPKKYDRPEGKPPPKRRAGGTSFSESPERRSGSGRSGFKSTPPRSTNEESDSNTGFFKKQNRPTTGKRYEAEAPVQTSQIRLNRYISNSGVCSRREADELIRMGLISVNGVTITEMGYKVNPGDVVKHESKTLTAEKPVYLLLNKPKGFITTTDDPQERNTVMHLVANIVKERIYPVGRLDRNTTGLLLLTNDGELTDKLTHPSYEAKKIYKVELDKPLTKSDFERIAEGVQLEEGKAKVDDIAIVSPDKKTIGIEIHIGWNRVIRRIFESLGYVVVKLDRTVYAGLDKMDLPRGHWRHLTREEVTRLKHLI